MWSGLIRRKSMFRALLVMRNTAFREMTNRREFGKKFLPKKELTRKSLSLARLKMATSLGFRAGEFSSTTTKKTGGVVAAAWIRHRLAILAVQIRKFFMTLVKKITTPALAKLTQPATVVDLWRSATKYLWNIDGLKMALSNRSKTKMSISVAVWSESQRRKSARQMFSRLVLCCQLSKNSSKFLVKNTKISPLRCA